MIAYVIPAHYGAAVAGIVNDLLKNNYVSHDPERRRAHPSETVPVTVWISVTSPNMTPHLSIRGKHVTKLDVLWMDGDNLSEDALRVLRQVEHWVKMHPREHDIMPWRDITS